MGRFHRLKTVAAEPSPAKSSANPGASQPAQPHLPAEQDLHQPPQPPPLTADQRHRRNLKVEKKIIRDQHESKFAATRSYTTRAWLAKSVQDKLKKSDSVLKVVGKKAEEAKERVVKDAKVKKYGVSVDPGEKKLTGKMQSLMGKVLGARRR